jgi:hypothetical protein
MQCICQGKFLEMELLFSRWAFAINISLPTECQLPAEGALHEAVEKMLQLLHGLALLGAQGFDFLGQRGEFLVIVNLR